MRITMSLFIWLITSVTTAAVAGAQPLGPIRLTVGDTIGIERTSEAVCSGVPFAKGTLLPDQPMRVESPSGQPVVTQAKVLGTWPDGSVKWLLVQFCADCPARGESVYRLVRGRGPAPEVSLQIGDEAEEVVVNTGLLRVTIPKNDLTVLGNVWPGEDDRSQPVLARGTPMRFVLADGTVHTSSGSKPESVIVEETGPVRATVRVVGWLRDAKGKRLYKLDTRLRFYAGQSYVKAEYTFICLGPPPLHQVKEIAVELSPSLGPHRRFVLPGDPQSIEDAPATDKPAVLSVDTNMVCRFGLDGEQKEAKRQLDGWAVLMGDRGALGVAIRDFWHLCPKAIELSPGQIKLALWSPRSAAILRLGRTRAKTHHILYEFTLPEEHDDVRLNRIRAFQQPLIATVDPEYFCSTDALGPLSPAGAPETAEYDRKVRQAFETLRRQRETMARENGMLHYGDYYHGGYGNKLTRGDLEYDTGHACFLLYARSGRRDYYDFAVACNQHFIDIDVNQETGEQRFHGYGDRAETHEAVTTGLEWGHVFVDCAADAYYLTGDERSLEAVRMIGGSVAAIADGQGYDKIRNIFAGAERQLGWPLMVLCRAYEVTGDEKYLKAATKVVDYIKTYAEDPVAAYREGKWWRSWMMDGCKLFMTGQLHDGLSAYYTITHDQGLREAIVRSLDWLIDNMWNPQVDGFVYEFNAMNRKHRQAGITGLNLLGVDAFRFGYEMTGDRRYLAVATRAFWGRVREMKPEVDGKQFSIDTRTSPHTAAYFHREHITPDSLPPSPQPIKQQTRPEPASPRAEILLHASFDGDLTCQTPRAGIEGRAVNEIEFVAGRRGQAVAVGKNGYVQLPAPSYVLSHPGSIELWVRLNFKKQPATPGQRAVFHMESETPLIDSLAACTIYGELRVRMKDHIGHLHGTAEGDVTDWEPGQWYHVVVTWDTERVKLYLDGVEQTREKEGEYAGDGVIALPTGNQTKINLGWRFGNWYCDCAIDELTVYSRLLTPDEVAARCCSE